MNRNMRTFLLWLLVLSPVSAEPLDLALPEPVRIEKAVYFWDGGSVKMSLRDSKGREYEVFHSHREGAPEKEHCFYYKSHEMRESLRIPKDSEDEAKLVRLLHAAAKATYGSSEVTFFDNAPPELKRKHGFDVFTMGNLFRRFPEKPAATPAKTR